MAKKKSPIYNEKQTSKQIIINGVPLPKWVKMTDKEKDSVRKKINK